MSTPGDYELIRSEFNAQTLDATERAAAFLYLNRHCFNGLMRYNLDHQFNVGWGKYKAPYYPMDEMKAFADMAHNCVFMTAGYAGLSAWPGKGMWFTAIRLMNRCREQADSQPTLLVVLHGMTRSGWLSNVLKRTNVARG
jgi:hypothetical protein